MTRQEIYKIIKENNLEERIKTVFKGKNYTNISTIDLESIVTRYLYKKESRKSNILSGITSEKSNEICNVKILERISEYVNNNKTKPFIQCLFDLGVYDIQSSRIIIEDSQKTLWRINQIINRMKK